MIVESILITLGAVLTYAVRMRYIDFNPCREIEKPKGQSTHSDKDEIMILQPDAIRALFNAANSQKERVFYMTAVFTGMREEELLGLQWDDMDWRNYQIDVKELIIMAGSMSLRARLQGARLTWPQSL